MIILTEILPKIDNPAYFVFLAIALILPIIAVWKKQLAMKAKTWPTIAAKIENVFIDVETHGGRFRHDVTQAALAYSYTVGESFFSGEIQLQAGDRSVEKLEAELIGQQVMVHYNPRKPVVSFFLKNSVSGWSVIRDSRISFSTWIGKF